MPQLVGFLLSILGSRIWLVEEEGRQQQFDILILAKVTHYYRYPQRIDVSTEVLVSRYWYIVPLLQ